jgi:hypothetical protein
MNFPVTKATLQNQSAITLPQLSHPSLSESFIERRVSNISMMVLQKAKSGQKSHEVNVIKSEILQPILDGLKVNFPDTTITPHQSTSKIVVDWA